MLISTASDSGAGGAAAWSLLQVSQSGRDSHHLCSTLCSTASWEQSCYLLYLPEPWLLAVGGLQAQCLSIGKDGVDRLAVSRGLLTCCRPHILLSSRSSDVNLFSSCFKMSHLRLVCRPHHIHNFLLFRSVCCWKVCSLWSMVCARRSWTVSTLPLKVRGAAFRLFVNWSSSACSDILCCCSVNALAEKS